MWTCSTDALRRSRRPQRVAPIAVLAAALAGGAACADTAVGSGSASAQLRVVVNVPLVLRLHAPSTPARFEVTEADIARGFVQLPAPFPVTVYSNSRHGYTLSIAKHADFVRVAHVVGLGGELRIDAAPAFSARQAPGRGLARDDLSLGFRFELADSARPGSYDWPISITAMPL